MIDTAEFCRRVRVERRELEAWIEAGWIEPCGGKKPRRFLDIDLSRAQLIIDLRRDMNVNDEAIPIVLHLLDQIHGLRHALRHALAAAGARDGGR